MKLLDRYIARQYLFNVLALTVILFSFIVTIDVSLNFNRLSGISIERLKAQGVLDPSALRKFFFTVYLAADLWWPRLLQLFNFMLGFVLVGAMGFTFSQLVKGRELVAVLASGLPLQRVARPVIVIALLLTGVQLINQEFIVPRIAPLLMRDHGDAGRRFLGADRVPLCADAQGRLWYAKSFDREAGTLQSVWVWERDAEGLATRKIKAAAATWRDGGWDLQDATTEVRQGSLGPAASTAQPITRLETDLDPVALTMRRSESFSQALSWSQLNQLLLRPEQLSESRRDQLDRTRWGRASIITANFLSLIIAVPFFLRREPANMAWQSVKCAPVAIVSLLGGVLGASAAIPGLPIPLAVFVPCLVLAPLAVAAATGIKT